MAAWLGMVRNPASPTRPCAETKAHDHSGITVDDSSARPGRFAALTQLRAPPIADPSSKWPEALRSDASVEPHDVSELYRCFSARLLLRGAHECRTRSGQPHRRELSRRGKVAAHRKSTARRRADSFC